MADGKTKVVKILRDVCVGKGKDEPKDAVVRIPEEDARLLIGEGSAEPATDEQLKAFEKAGGSAAIYEARRKAEADEKEAAKAAAIEKAKAGK